MLGKFHKLLKPEGYVLLDVYSLASFEPRQEIARYELIPLDGFWSPNKYIEFLNTFKYEKEKVVLDKYTIVEADRLRTIYNWLQYFDPCDLKIDIVESEFKVAEFYSDVTGNMFDPQAGEFAVIAIKP
jgi:hypothetical protein